MALIREIKVLLASPSDLKSERSAVMNVIDLVNANAKRDRIRFEIVSWEKQALPGIGEYPQDVVNKTLDSDYEILLALFWQRLGSPTQSYESGTMEEVERAISKCEANPDSVRVMIYFKTAPPDDLYSIDIKQFEKVKDYKLALGKRGVLYTDFDSEDSLRQLLIRHFAKYLEASNERATQSTEKDDVIVNELDKYELLAQQIDLGQTNSVFEEISEITDSSVNDMESASHHLSLVTDTLNFIAGKFNERAKQINAFGGIRDKKLRETKIEGILLILSKDLNEYTNEMNQILPTFSQKINSAYEGYARLLFLLTQSEYLPKTHYDEVRTSLISLSETMESVKENISEYLKALGNIKHSNVTFENSRRKAELATNAFFKVVLSSHKVLKELISE